MAGNDYIIIETVGAGQADLDVVNIADTVCVVLAPGLGGSDTGHKVRYHGNWGHIRGEQEGQGRLLHGHQGHRGCSGNDSEERVEPAGRCHGGPQWGWYRRAPGAHRGAQEVLFIIV
ncbi:hypothetical protein [Thermogymnomonas acidicola]|uniref:hypothetical protein n=1 Tax=Thermogymnomonas acidicola TaxID=399579 RepID=UPI001493F9BF|nr:hypothetical protein [Thermogymnomonas acidicola]